MDYYGNQPSTRAGSDREIVVIANGPGTGRILQPLLNEGFIATSRNSSHWLVSAPIGSIRYVE